MDTQKLAVYLALAVFIGGFVVIIVWSLRVERNRQTALRTVVERHGWEYAHSPGTSRRAAHLCITPTDAGWRLDIRRRRNRGKHRGQDPGRSEFVSPTPYFQNNLVMLIGPGARGLTGAMGALSGVLDNAFGRGLLSRLFGPEIAEHAGNLRNYAPPEGSGLSVLASDDPTPLFDLPAIGAHLSAWPRQRGANAGPPVVMIHSEGLRVALNYELDDPARIEAFIALGEQLVAVARR